MSDQNRNAAIFYEVDGFSTTGERLLGRQVAGESFLRGFVKNADLERFFCYTDHPGKFQLFKKQISDYRLSKPKAEWINPLELHKIRNPGCVFYSGPGLGSFAWQRQYITPNAYSLCGLTHTTCSREAMDAFGQLITGPLHEWDALICTSQSVKKTVEYALGNYAEHLAERGGGKFDIRVQLPILPLGINCDEFEWPDTADAYVKEFKDRHSIGSDDIVVLYVGRLASHAKAHPLLMYQALEKAVRKTGKKVHLVQSGWFATESIERQFVEGAKKFCPSVNCIFIDGRDKDTRKHIWHVGDIFTTLADNIQETFGITPLEAMAAGMPVVATDWDGYRETVRDGVDGFLVRTTMPEPGSGLPLSYRYQLGVDHYDRYIGQVSLFTNVDTDHCAECFIKLIENPDLRKKMGEAGRDRAKGDFDWQVLIPKYQDLWSSLAEKRLAAQIEKPKVAVPLIDDPFSTFAHYPTELMTANSRLSLQPDARGSVGRYLKDSLGNGVIKLLPSEEKLEQMLTHIDEAGDEYWGSGGEM
ncbi:glycosyltransferase family 4 protein [Sneathiella glossodoripedis]|uniref:glycosyltransferase family 4 protein n=1 Tax=Sneathiella glossodoripedis TaxID=418853 RepID=UPI00047143E1|nr:glycosyltransferase family 4 protein [Sneathiella glossodoripedis]